MPPMFSAHRSWDCIKWTFLLSLMLSVSSNAQLPLARLDSVFPMGCSVGSKIDVTLSGQDLDGVSVLSLGQSNIVTHLKTSDSIEDVPPNPWIVEVGSSVAPGYYEIRAKGRFGISNPRVFHVSPFADVTRRGDNKSLGKAQDVELNRVINGRLEANAADFYKVRCVAEKTLVIIPHTRALDSKLDAIVVLYDADRRELKRVRSGESLEYPIKQAGNYYIEIRDTTYRGGDEFGYRLEITDGPWVKNAFPPVVRPGQLQKTELIGFNLPRTGSGIELLGEAGGRMRVSLSWTPTENESEHGLLAVGGRMLISRIGHRERAWFLPKSVGFHYPLHFGVASNEVALEEVGNDSPEKAQQLNVPCEWVGRFETATDMDWAWFEAKKGEIWRVEVISQRMGFHADPHLLVQEVSKNGNDPNKAKDVAENNDLDSNIGGREFRTSSFDAAVKVEAKADTAFRIQIRNQALSSRVGESVPYRVVVSRDVPDFEIVAAPLAPPSPRTDTREAFVWTTFLRRGATVPIQVFLMRKHEFQGAVEITATGLPPGVTGHPLMIESGKNSGVLLLTASDSAKPWSGRIQLLGSMKGDGPAHLKSVSRTAQVGTLIWTVKDYNLEPIHSRLAQSLELSVSETETSPVTIRAINTEPISLAEGSKTQIQLAILRQNEWASNLKLKASGLSLVDSLKELEIDGKGTNVSFELDAKQLKLPTGTHRFYWVGTTQGKHRNHPEVAKSADEKSKTLDKEVEAATTSVKALQKKLAKLPKEEKESIEKLQAEIKESETQLKALQVRRDVAKKRAKEASDRAQPKDVTIQVFSEPIVITVVPAKS